MSSSTPKNLRLVASGSESDDLQKYLNHKVEIRGTLENAAHDTMGAGSTTGSTAGSTAGSTSSTTAGSTSGYGSSARWATLRVSSVKDVSDTCSGAQR